MKTTLTCITRRSWEKIKREAAESVSSIPEKHNRVRAHAYADAIASGLGKRTKLRQVEPIGKPCIWYHTVNLGYSKRYSDWVREYTESIVEKQSKGDTFVLRHTNGYTENVIIIYG